MEYCNLVFKLYLKNGKAYIDSEDLSTECEAVDICEKLEDEGFDEVMIFNLANSREEHELNIHIVKEVIEGTDIRVLLGGDIHDIDDVKRYLYSGAKIVILDADVQNNRELISESCVKFGADKVAVMYNEDAKGDTMADVARDVFELGAGLLITNNKISKELAKSFGEINTDVLLTNDEIEFDDVVEYSKYTDLYGISSKALIKNIEDVMYVKNQLKKAGVRVNSFESKINFSDFKLNEQGLIPVVVQEYKTGQVLMVAYMNEESFNETIRTGKMTYYSRSRQSLWLKGETSGHFQFVKSLKVDCDKDTILAKVKQIGVACHTGSYSCFFNELVQKEYDDKNPLNTFKDVYDVILDRKNNPKETSYTNELLNKGTDNIIKKLGEESADIVIATKNGNKDETVYQIADYMYHLMVLMADRDISWEDVTRELIRRR